MLLSFFCFKTDYKALFSAKFIYKTLILFLYSSSWLRKCFLASYMEVDSFSLILYSCYARILDEIYSAYRNRSRHCSTSRIKLSFSTLKCISADLSYELVIYSYLICDWYSAMSGSLDKTSASRVCFCFNKS